MLTESRLLITLRVHRNETRTGHFYRFILFLYVQRNLSETRQEIAEILHDAECFFPVPKYFIICVLVLMSLVLWFSTDVNERPEKN